MQFAFWGGQCPSLKRSPIFLGTSLKAMVGFALFQVSSEGPDSLLRAPVIMLDLYLVQVDVLEDAQVDRGHRGAFLVGLAMRMDAAGRAEAVRDDVLVEEIILERVRTLGELHARARNEPEWRALAMADRAVAHDRALDVAFHLELDRAAVTASFVLHAR